MINPIYVVDIIRDVVTSITPGLLPILQANETAALSVDDPKLSTKITTIDYQYGHVLELISTLFQYDKSNQLKLTKYPLVYLVQDFPEVRGGTDLFYAKVTLNIVIAHQTDATYKVGQRYAKVFKPVLYPIYYALLQGLAVHPLINNGSTELMPHTKFDRAYWGSQPIAGETGNKLNDYVDAIDITNLKLTILNNNC